MKPVTLLCFGGPLNEQLVTTLRGIVADQAVIVRAALGRPQKRRIPGEQR